MASHFSSGGIFETYSAKVQTNEISHIERKTLIDLLQGYGKGKAKWGSSQEVLMARKYAEESMEHLLDFSEFAHLTPEQLQALVDKVFK